MNGSRHSKIRSPICRNGKVAWGERSFAGFSGQLRAVPQGRLPAAGDFAAALINSSKRGTLGAALGVDAAPAGNERPARCFFRSDRGYRSACMLSSARASWSGHEVPRPRQSMPLSRATASSARMPSTSAAMPCVLPWQPPANSTLRITSPSSSISICFEQVPTQG